eukprot:gene12928-7437_t
MDGVEFVSSNISGEQNYLMWFYGFVHDATVSGGKFTVNQSLNYSYESINTVEYLWEIWESCERYIQTNDKLAKAELDFGGNILSTFKTKPKNIQGKIKTAISTLGEIVSIASACKYMFEKKSDFPSVTIEENSGIINMPNDSKNVKIRKNSGIISFYDVVHNNEEKKSKSDE